MYIGKLFDNYDIDFPIEKDLSIIIGENDSGKTQILYLLKEYFENLGENVVLLSENRKVMIDEDDILNIDISNKLMYKNSLKQTIEHRYDINDPFVFDNHKKGDYIKSGYMQLLNMYYYLALQPNDSIIMIDIIEINLHVILQAVIVNDLIKIFNFKKLIITTHSLEVIKWIDKNNVISIQNIVKLHNDIKN